MGMAAFNRVRRHKSNQRLPNGAQTFSTPLEAPQFTPDFADMTVAKMRKYAAENGIDLPSGANRAAILETLQAGAV